MADNASLGAAKNAKNDEFYTQYSDIEAEMNAYVEFDPDVFRGKTILLPCDDPEWSNFTKYFASNFERFGLKKLISTSYAKGAANKQLSFFEMSSPLYDEELHDAHGKLFTLTRDLDGSGGIDTDDIEFSGYLEGDGDFRSAEVCRLRDEADIIITNPPFSMFREFLAWIIAGKKQFAIIGNQNAITYKEVFPLLKDNKMWLGYSIHSGDRKFNVPDDYPLEAATCGIDPDGKKFIRVKGVRWFTDIDHGQRHEPLMLDTMAHNLKYNKKLRKKFEEEYGTNEYPHYDNYDAIEVPFTECIPSDYVPCWFNCPKAKYCEWAAKKGIDGETSALCESARTGDMGVPITFLDKHDPEQFEIIGADYELAKPELLENGKTGTGRFYIKKGVDKQNDISDNQLSSAQLSSAQLSSAQLSSAQLSSAQLSSAQLSSAAALCADRHSPQDVTALWAYRSLSSTSTTLSSSKSLELSTTEATANGISARVGSTEKKNSSDLPSVSKCSGTMGVPITFLDKYNPDQFDIIGCADYTGKYGSDEIGIRRIGEEWLSQYKKGGGKGHYTANMTSLVFYGSNGAAFPTFKRILIRRKKGANE